MKKVNRKMIIVFLIISIVGIFLPWFYFEKTVDFSTGSSWCLNIGFLLGYIGSFSFIFVDERSKEINICNLIFLILIPLTCIYLFFTWHIETITGELDFRTSIETAHYGFYITLISSTVSTIIYLVKLIHKKL